MVLILQEETRGDLLMRNTRHGLKTERALLVQARGALIESIQRWTEQPLRESVRVDLVAMCDEYFTHDLAYQHRLEEALAALDHSRQQPA
jgi:hypothetical protein